MGEKKKYLVSPGYRTNLEYVKLGIKQSDKLNKVVRIRPPPPNISLRIRNMLLKSIHFVNGNNYLER